MNASSRTVLIALLVAIVALLLLVAHKASVNTTGQEVTLPIEGYDPRDLLSGHYLIYRIQYGVEGICSSRDGKDGNAGFVCLNPPGFSDEPSPQCALFIRGACEHGRFKAGIERFFIPESEAKRLEELVRDKQASIVISVPSNGRAQVKELLIDGRPWTSY